MNKGMTMNMRSRALSGVLVAGALSLGGLASAAPANATTSYPEGGTWDYNPGYSNYYHPSRVHRTTACNGANTCNRSADTAKGATARATVNKTPYGNTAYYYNY